MRFDQHERIHVAWCDADGDDVPHAPAGLEALEAMAFGGRRWWAVDDLVASDEPVLPRRLREFLPGLVEGRLPTEPIDITSPPEL
jgi:hypothetical protein